MNKRPEDIQQWSRFFHDHYGAANQGRKWHEFAVMIGARVCFAISPKHRARPPDFGWHMSKAFAWMIGLHNHVAKPFSDKRKLGSASDIGWLLLAEFPRCCPYCDEPTCNYVPALHNSARRKERRNAAAAKCVALLRETPGVRNFTLQDWAEVISVIYPRDNRSSADFLAGKIAEEYAELIRELGDRRKPSAEKFANYAEEFSDLFSRMCVLSARMLATYADQKPASELRTIDDLVWKTYKNGCPSCFKRRTLPEDPCMCSAIEKEEGQPGFWGDDDLFGPSGRLSDEPD